jgi:membrane dipeptidase
LIRPVTQVADIHAAKEEKRVEIIFGFQNSSPLEGDLDLVEVFYRLGVRVIQLTYNDLNFAGAGCYERQDVGLSQFGVDLIREMNRLGMIVDLSHVGYRTTMEAIEVSEQPVWFSHVNPKALKDHVRNKTDEQVCALVAKGGVVGANIFPPFLKRGYEAGMEDLVEVIDHWVKVAGVDHVAIGLDYTENQSDKWLDWIMQGKRRGEWKNPLQVPLKMARAIDRSDKIPNITEALSKRGYSAADVQKIMGLNLMSLFEKVWKARWGRSSLELFS